MKHSHKLYGIERIHRLALIGLDASGWYDTAAEEIMRVCVAEGWNPIKFSTEIAILSPKIAIRRNMRAALAYHGQGRFLRDIVSNVRKSMATYQDSGVIGGFKVPYFARALNGDSESITLDTWMSIAMIREPAASVPMFRRRATRDAANTLIRKVGKRLGLSPRDCQAAVWTGINREYGKQTGLFPVWEEYETWLAYDRRFPLSGVIESADVSFNTEEFF